MAGTLRTLDNSDQIVTEIEHKRDRKTRRAELETDPMPPRFSMARARREWKASDIWVDAVSRLR